MDKAEFTKEELKMILNLIKSYVNHLPYEFTSSDSLFDYSVSKFLDKANKYVLLQEKTEIMIKETKKNDKIRNI